MGKVLADLSLLYKYMGVSAFSNPFILNISHFFLLSFDIDKGDDDDTDGCLLPF